VDILPGGCQRERDNICADSPYQRDALLRGGAATRRPFCGWGHSALALPRIASNYLIAGSTATVVAERRTRLPRRAYIPDNIRWTREHDAISCNNISSFLLA